MHIKTNQQYQFGLFILDPRKRLLKRSGEVVPLTPKAFDMLLLLVEGSGKIVRKDELMNRLWPDTFVEESNLAFQVSTLRKALGESPNDHRYIVTIPGQGYRFSGEVRQVESELEAEAVDGSSRLRRLGEELDGDSVSGRTDGTDHPGPSMHDLMTPVPGNEMSLDSEVSEASLGLRWRNRYSILAANFWVLLRRRLSLGWLTAVLLIATIASTIAYFKRARTSERTIITEILPPESAQFSFTGPSGGPPVLSPDGRALAFSATDTNGKKMLWVRSLDSSAARPLAGTEGAAWPFWSADSRALGFFANDKLKTIEVSGTPAVDLADAPIPGGGSWNRDGTILFVPDYHKRQLYKVAASGGAPVTVIAEDSSQYSVFAWPRFLPDGKHFLLYVAGSADPALDGTYFASLDGKENRLLLRGDGLAMYASGFVLYLRNSILMAQTFDPERGELKGNSHPVSERVVEDSDRGPFDASENDVLIYQQAVGKARGRRLRWFDRTGKELELPGETGAYWDVRLSADGRKLAFNVGQPYSDMWVNDLARGVRMRLTIDSDTDHAIPVWSPDGSRILFAAIEGKTRKGIYQKLSNGAGSEELLLASDSSDKCIYPTSWSSDGRFILYTRGHPGVHLRGELWVLPLVGDRKPCLFVKRPAPAYDGQFSTDARWVAYTSKESGREEVYVVPFDAAKVLNAAPGSPSATAGGNWIISTSGGCCPRWRKDGKEIFYLSPENKMMAVGVQVRDNSIELQPPRPLFTIVPADSSDPYDVAPDGSKFVINTHDVQNKALTLVVNWTAFLGNKP